MIYQTLIRSIGLLLVAALVVDPTAACVPSFNQCIKQPQASISVITAQGLNERALPFLSVTANLQKSLLFRQLKAAVRFGNQFQIKRSVVPSEAAGSPLIENVLSRRLFTLFSGLALPGAAVAQTLPGTRGRIAELQMAARDLLVDATRSAAITILLQASASTPTIHLALLTFLLRERLRQEVAAADHQPSAWLTQLIQATLNQSAAADSLWALFTYRPESELGSLSLSLVAQGVAAGTWTRNFQPQNIKALATATLSPATSAVAISLIQGLDNNSLKGMAILNLFNFYRIAVANNDQAMKTGAAFAIRTLSPIDTLATDVQWDKNANAIIDILATDPRLDSVELGGYAVLSLAAKLQQKMREAVLNILMRVRFNSKNYWEHIVRALIQEMKAAKALNDRIAFQQMEYGLHYFLAFPETTDVMLETLDLARSREIRKDALVWLASDPHFDLSRSVVKGHMVSQLIQWLEDPGVRTEVAKVLHIIDYSLIDDDLAPAKTGFEKSWATKISQGLALAKDAEGHEREVGEKIQALLGSAKDIDEFKKEIKAIGDEPLRARVQSRFDSLGYQGLLGRALETEDNFINQEDFLQKLGQYMLFYGGDLQLSSQGQLIVIKGLANPKTKVASVIILAENFPVQQTIREKALEALLKLRAQGNVTIDPKELEDFIDQKVAESGLSPQEGLKKLLSGQAGDLVQTQVLRRLAGSVDIGLISDNYATLQHLQILFALGGLSDAEASSIVGAIKDPSMRKDFETGRLAPRVGGIQRQYAAGDLMASLFERAAIIQGRLLTLYADNQFDTEARIEALKLVAEGGEDQSEFILDIPPLARQLARDSAFEDSKTIIGHLKNVDALNVVHQQILLIHPDWFITPQHRPFLREVLEQTEQEEVIRAAISLLEQPGWAETSNLGIKGILNIIATSKGASLRDSALAVLGRLSAPSGDHYVHFVEALLAEKLRYDARRDTEMSQRILDVLKVILSRQGAPAFFLYIADNILDHPMRALVLALLEPQKVAGVPSSRRGFFSSVFRAEPQPSLSRATLRQAV